MARHTIDTSKATGFGADIGGLYMANENLRVGGMIRNLVPPQYKFNTETEEFPKVARLGASANLFSNRLLTALDIEQTIGADRAIKWHTGFEASFVRSLILRAGINSNEITAGVGIGWRAVTLDYGVGFNDLGVSNMVSLKLFFGGYDVDVTVSDDVFSPVGLKNKTSFRILCANRNRVVKWVLSIKSTRGEVVRSFQGYSAPPDSIEWDGKTVTQGRVESGVYQYRIIVTDKYNHTEASPTRQLRIISPTPLELEAK